MYGFIDLCDWVHFQGKQLSHFYCCFPFKLGSSHKEKNLLPLEQIHSFKSRPHFRKPLFYRKANRKSQKLSPFENMAEKDGGVTP